MKPCPEDRPQLSISERIELVRARLEAHRRVPSRALFFEAAREALRFDRQPLF